MKQCKNHKIPFSSSFLVFHVSGMMGALIGLVKWPLFLCCLFEKTVYQLLTCREAKICKEGLVAAPVCFCLIAFDEQMICGVTTTLQKLRKQAQSNFTGIFYFHV